MYTSLGRGKRGGRSWEGNGENGRVKGEEMEGWRREGLGWGGQGKEEDEGGKGRDVSGDILVLKLISVLVFILFSSQNFYFI